MRAPAHLMKWPAPPQALGSRNSGDSSSARHSRQGPCRFRRRRHRRRAVRPPWKNEQVGSDHRATRTWSGGVPRSFDGSQSISSASADHAVNVAEWVNIPITGAAMPESKGNFFMIYLLEDGQRHSTSLSSYTLCQHRAWRPRAFSARPRSFMYAMERALPELLILGHHAAGRRTGIPSCAGCAPSPRTGAPARHEAHCAQQRI